MGKLTQKGAVLVTRDINKLAALFEADYATLNLSQKVASNLVERLDKVADHIEATVGLDPEDMEKKAAILASFDAETIGEEKAGPVDTVEAVEPFMKGEFTQVENEELSDKQEGGDLGKAAALKTAAVQFLRLASDNKVKVGEYLKQHIAAEKAAKAEKTAKVAAVASQQQSHGYRLDA